MRGRWGGGGRGACAHTASQAGWLVQGPPGLACAAARPVHQSQRSCAPVAALAWSAQLAQSLALGQGGAYEASVAVLALGQARRGVPGLLQCWLGEGSSPGEQSHFLTEGLILAILVYPCNPCRTWLESQGVASRGLLLLVVLLLYCCDLKSADALLLGGFLIEA